MVVIDDCLKLTFRDFLKSDLLKERTSIHSVLKIKKGYREYEFEVICKRSKNLIQFRYFYNNNLKEYDVKLIYYPSNFGHGEVGYFLCPFMGNKCRTLYFLNGYFMGRNAFKGIYECQRQSKKEREFVKYFKVKFGVSI